MAGGSCAGREKTVGVAGAGGWAGWGAGGAGGVPGLGGAGVRGGEGAAVGEPVKRVIGGTRPGVGARERAE